MKVNDRFLPRIWDGEKYFYPVFSELGITYENKGLSLTEENIKSLDWAFGWHFSTENKDTSLEFDHIIEDCTGLRDRKGKLIYKGDIIKCPLGIYTVAVDSFGLWTAVYENNPILGVEEWSDFVKKYLFDEENKKIEVIGNIHENPELLESEER